MSKEHPTFFEDRMAAIKGWLGRYFGSSSNQPYGQYAPLVAASLAASQARMIDWTFEPTTMSIDPQTASLDELRNALIDCRECIAAEYPETEGGTYRAMNRAEELRSALRSRFANSAEAILAEARERGMSASRNYHGGP